MAASQVDRGTGNIASDAAGAGGSTPELRRPTVSGPATVRAGTEAGDRIASGDIDVIASLASLAESDGRNLRRPGLGDQLLAYVAPRPRDPETLRAPRIAPLLGLAAEILARQDRTTDDIVHLGAVALEQELRLHAMLAERRANQIEG